MRACSRAIASARAPSRRPIVDERVVLVPPAGSPAIGVAARNAPSSARRREQERSTCSSARPAPALRQLGTRESRGGTLVEPEVLHEHLDAHCVRTMASSSRQQSRRGSSSSSDSSRSAAGWLPCPRALHGELDRVVDIGARELTHHRSRRPGSARSPSCSSVMSAIRSGVRDTPSSSTRRNSGPSARGKGPVEQGARGARASPSSSASSRRSCRAARSAA